MIARPLRAVLSLVLAGSLAGCVSLLPKAKPATLFALGGEPSAVDAQALDTRGVSVEPIGFPREAITDGILTVEKAQVSYLGGARWAAPAPILFRQTMSNVFFGTAPTVRLLGRGEIGRLSAMLGLDVVRFQAEYATPNGAPTVRVTLQARLAKADGTPLAAKSFDASVPATENGAGAIVIAYRAAATQALTALAQWVDQNAPQPAAPASTSTVTSTKTTATTTTRQP